MPKTIVLCSDGTGNTFDRRVTNVTHIVHCLRLDIPDRQVVLYDQGVGTVRRRLKSVRSASGLCVLDAPKRGLRPSRWFKRIGGLVAGVGLDENVKEIFCRLAREFDDGDKVLLFGFSRGAFTARAVAGMLYRFGLPYPGTDDELEERFWRCWALFPAIQPTGSDSTEIETLRSEHRTVCVHCLGLWDTVKSYGGLRPVMLPHLRHNPRVVHVRHALALREHRAWFKHTTWGRLDRDRDEAMTKLVGEDRAKVEDQDIKEVWFDGYHSDIGAGKTTLRWMLSEVAAVTPELALSQCGRDLLAETDEEPADYRDSMNVLWRLVELVPRKEIHNDRKYPRLEPHRGSDGDRHPDEVRRETEIHVHVTADATALPPPVHVWETEPPRRFQDG